MKALLVVGSREFQNYTLMSLYLDRIIGDRKDICIVSGGARGADSLARDYAKYHNIKYKEFPAEWELYGRSAGYRRNEKMHQYIASYKEREVIAFWDGQSKGTAHNFELAKRYDNPIQIIRY